MKNRAWSKYLEGILVNFYLLDYVNTGHYFRGSGVECRKLVQELNMKKADLDQDYEMMDFDTEQEVIYSNQEPEVKNVFYPNSQTQIASSKWSKYL